MTRSKGQVGNLEHKDQPLGLDFELAVEGIYSSFRKAETFSVERGRLRAL